MNNFNQETHNLMTRETMSQEELQAIADFIVSDSAIVPHFDEQSGDIEDVEISPIAEIAEQAPTPVILQELLSNFGFFVTLEQAQQIFELVEL